MILLPDMKNKKTAVFGLGATGLATAKALVASGAQVFTWDESAAAREKVQNTEYHADHPKNWPWAEFQFLALSPGIPLKHPKPHAIVRKAQAAKVRILGDLELYALAMNTMPESERPKIVAITGSNGKSTTTALIAHILSDTGREAVMGGNIGLPLLAMPAAARHQIHVLELSSFQLDLAASLKADISLLLNVSPDHLDRHGDMESYAAAKRRIFDNQGPNDTAIICVDDEYTQIACALVSGNGSVPVLPVSTQGALGHGVYTLDGRMYYNVDGKSGEAGVINQIASLQGAHNWQNASAALAATIKLGVAPAVGIKAMERFRGLAHRMEIVARQGGVSFVNDSKATNAQAAKGAISSHNNVFWIAGGVEKEGGVTELRPLMDRVRGAYLIGECADQFEGQLAGSVPCVQCGNLAAAVSRASRDAAESGIDDVVVLLSPAAASQDQFKNFEDRGETFRRLVLDLIGAEEAEVNQKNGAAA